MLVLIEKLIEPMLDLIIQKWFQENKIVGLWNLINDNTVLRLQLGLDILNWNIDTLNADKLSVSYIESGNIQNAGYIPLE